MKKGSLIALMLVMVTTPSFANLGSNPFVIEGTTWVIDGTEDAYRFLNGEVHTCVPIGVWEGFLCVGTGEPYIDFQFLGIFKINSENIIGFVFPIIGFGIVFDGSGSISILIQWVASEPEEMN